MRPKHGVSSSLARDHLDQPTQPLISERCSNPAMALKLRQSVQGSPKSFSRDFRVGAERLNDRHHGSKRVTQDLRRVGLRKPEPGRQNEHGFVQRWPFERETEICRGDGLDSLFRSCICGDASPQCGGKFAKTLKRDRSNDSVAIFEMGVEYRLAVFDLLRQASDSHGRPAILLGKGSCCGDNALLPLYSLPLFTLADTHTSTV